jgi:hypothetical protein
VIHEIGLELQAYLHSAAVKYPFSVVDGPENTQTTTGARERIVIERDPDGDTFDAPRSQTKTPKHLMLRNIGVKITIYAQSPAPGAAQFEHYRRAEHVLDLVLCGLYSVLRARKNEWTVTKGRFVTPEDFQGTEAIVGAVYELHLTIERAVFVQSWAYETAPTAAVTAFRSTTNVGIAGQTGTETGCGGS